MIFEQLNPHACRTYLLGTEGSNEVVIVDPVLEHVGDYIELLGRRRLMLSYAIDTHTHADHISGGAALRDQTGCEYVMHTNAPAPCITIRVPDGFECKSGSVSVKVLHTPGHTKDSICLILPDRILTGDALFLDEGGAGRDDLPGGDPGEHWDSLQRIMGLPDHLVVYPAHEYRNRQPSSLGEQKLRNPHLNHRTRDEYVKYIEGLCLGLGPADWMKDVLKANYACARDPKAAWVPVDVPACEVMGTAQKCVNEQQAPTISPDEVRRRMDSGDAPVLLDVREVDELEGELGSLPGIRHIPVGSLSECLPDLEADRGKELVTICRSGGRANTAAQILLQAGFQQVFVLEGGMSAFRKAEGSVEDSS